MKRVLFFIGATAPSGAESHHFRGFTIIFRHTTPGRTLWKNDDSVAEIFTRFHTTLTRGKPMETTKFEPEIPVSEGPQTHTLDRAATGISRWMEKVLQNIKKSLRKCTVSLPKRKVYAATRKRPWCVKDSKLSRRQNMIIFPNTCCGISELNSEDTLVKNLTPWNRVKIQ